MSDVRSRVCRLCGHDELKVEATLRDVPRFNHRLLREDELLADIAIDLPINRCKKCGFVSVPFLLGDDYYTDYENAPSMSAFMASFIKEQAQELVSTFDLKGKTILDVGCGDGGFMSQLEANNAKCYGLEPSHSQRMLAREKGLEVSAGYLTEDIDLEGSPFDAIVSRQVFEHVEDMHGFLAAICAHLKPGGICLIEVPNLSKLVRENRFFDFIPEHINYFDERTLPLIMSMAGFFIEKVEEVQGGEALSVVGRWNEPSDLTLFGMSSDLLRREITAFIQKERELKKRVGIWGAGGKGLSILATCVGSEVDVLVDTDPSKWGRFTPVTHMQVRRPTEALLQGIDALLITAPLYRKEIAEEATSKYGFTGKIAVISNCLEIIRP